MKLQASSSGFFTSATKWRLPIARARLSRLQKWYCTNYLQDAIANTNHVSGQDLPKTINLEGLSRDQILDYFEYTTSSKPPEVRNSLTFHCPAPQLDELLHRLEEVTKSKIDYDTRTKLFTCSVIGQGELHCILQNGLSDFFEAAAMRNLPTTIPDEVCRRLRLVQYRIQASIKTPTFITQADVAFHEEPFQLPSLVCEIS